MRARGAGASRGPLARAAAAVALAVTTAAWPPSAQACSSCGCTLSSDWASQGYAAGPGFHLDLRFDSFDQDRLMSGRGAVDRSAIPLPTGRELQQRTLNRNTSLVLDYSPNAQWGIDLQVPYYDRYHATIAPGDTATSTSRARGLGDIRLLGRFQGFSPDHTTGVQLGLKLATGGFHGNFAEGPQAGTRVDRGLQPGTGTTDLLVGVYHYGTIAPSWDYFAQALLQQPLNSRERFKPGTGINVNLGVRYAAHLAVVPQIQLNLRAEKRESGANADVENSGATLVYLGPGVTVGVARRVEAYAFVQVPIYQNVNGYQLEPRFAVSGGLHFTP